MQRLAARSPLERQRQARRIVERIALLLPAGLVERLPEVAALVEEPHADERDAELRRGLEVVAREHAEAARSTPAGSRRARTRSRSTRPGTPRRDAPPPTRSSRRARASWPPRRRRHGGRSPRPPRFARSDRRSALRGGRSDCGRSPPSRRDRGRGRRRAPPATTRTQGSPQAARASGTARRPSLRFLDPTRAATLPTERHASAHRDISGVQDARHVRKGVLCCTCKIFVRAAAPVRDISVIQDVGDVWNRRSALTGASHEPTDAAEVARPDRDDAHLARRVRRLDHLPAADVHGDVADDRVLVEEEVAGQQLRERDRRP